MPGVSRQLFANPVILAWGWNSSGQTHRRCRSGFYIVLLPDLNGCANAPSSEPFPEPNLKTEIIVLRDEGNAV